MFKQTSREDITVWKWLGYNGQWLKKAVTLWLSQNNELISSDNVAIDLTL